MSFVAQYVHRVRHLIAGALGLPEEYFDQFFQHPSQTLALLHYPPGPNSADEGAFGCGAHSDWPFCSLLVDDGNPGLQLHYKGDVWPGALAATLQSTDVCASGFVPSISGDQIIIYYACESIPERLAEVQIRSYNMFQTHLVASCSYGVSTCANCATFKRLLVHLQGQHLGRAAQASLDPPLTDAMRNGQSQHATAATQA